MLTRSSVSLLVCLAGIVHGRVCPRGNDTRSIQWGKCPFNDSTGPIECGNLLVPLDYTGSSSNRTLNLEILRSPALVQPSKGSIFFNFGGPGVDGRSQLAVAAPTFHLLTGGNFDLIAVDPRGTGKTLKFTCYNDEVERMIASLTTPIHFGNSSDVALGRNWANMKIFADGCAAKQAEMGQFIGTAFTARDMMQVVDALGGDGLLNFWGFSYGTVLGATVAAMFPDRMGHLVLDGVQNPHEYYHDYDLEWFSSNADTFTAFIEECLAQPSNCPLASQGLDAPALEAAIFTFIDEIKYKPFPLNGMLIDYQLVKTAILAAMYSTYQWPDLASGLNGLLTGNTSAWADFMVTLGPGELTEVTEHQHGIKCSDKIKRASKIEDTLPTLEALMEMSRLGGDMTTSLLMACAQWGFDAKERYLGDFRVKTRTPMLVVGNTNDPYTPLVSARNVSAGFEGSVLLHHNGSGHCTLGQASACTMGYIGAYFLNGTLPALGTVCQPDSPVFAASDTTASDVALASIQKRWFR